MVILHYMNEGNYRKAIEYLQNLKEDQISEFIRRNYAILMRHEPGT